MKNVFVAFVAAVGLLGLANLASGAVPSRADQWKKVEDAINKGLPKTAITNLDEIIPAALKDKAYGEAAKAVARKIVLEGNIQGNKPEEKITRMDAEIARAPKEILPVLKTLRAHWYWHYFQQNRWRFLQRTATAAPPGKDFTTWDLPRIYAEIDKHFQDALSHADALKATPVAMVDDLLTKGTVPDSYRPTLYDFIANEALKFYTSGEQAGAKPEDAFEISSDSPIFDSVEKFLAWKPDTTQSDSPKLKAILLYQGLLRFHEKDKDPAAFIDADIARLQWGQGVAFGENKNARYIDALKAIEDKWADHELSAYAKYRRARVLQEEGKLVEARDLAKRAEQVFPNSIGGKKAHNLVQEIEARSAAIATERVWNKPWPRIAVRYKNLSQVFFRAVPWDWNDFLQRNRTRPEWLNQAERSELLTREVAYAWSAKLPPTPDYKERVEELPAPENLKPGHYFLVASHNAEFAETDNQVTFTDFWVSDLALVVVTREGRLEGFVLDADSGDPIAAAEVVAWYLDRNGSRVQNGEPQKTDQNGTFSFQTQENRNLLVRARARGQELASMQEYYSWRRGKGQPYDTAVFFTDRALYRPGQTVSYKGIFVHVDQDKDDYELITSRKLEVIFADPNGKEVAKTTHTTTDNGSFSGSFTAPRDRVMGQYQIYTSAGNGGATHFSVEEYKRPKFQVTLDTPKTAPKLNDQVALAGKAEAYTGAAVDGAKVKWRVVREVRWPDWWYWWGWGWRGGGRSSESQEIAHGMATTGVDGRFPIEFAARPDPQVDPKSEVTFRFRIYADVTDTAGETRSADRSVNVGFVALAASVTAEGWQTDDKAVELKVKTTTLDGDAQTAEGSLKVLKLKEPERVERARLPGLYFDDDPDPDGKAERKDLSNPMNWPEDAVVVEKGWTTDAEGKTTVQARLGVGVYRAVLETQDRFGKKVTARTQITVLQPAATKLAIKVPDHVSAPKWQAEPGQEFMALWGTGYERGRAFVEVEHRGQRLQRYWTAADVTQHQIKQAITEAMRGGFMVYITRVRENRAYPSNRYVDVPWSNKDLELKWEHFTSKLEPGQKETWSLEIRDPKSEIRKAEKVAAELVAALYDESLDAYRKQAWLRKFNFFRQEQTYRSVDFCNVARGFNHLKGAWKSDTRNADLRYREFPADLVANFWGYGWMAGGRTGRLASFARRGGEAEQLGEPTMLFDAAVPAAPTAALAMNGLAVAKAEASPAALPPAGAAALQGRGMDKAGGGGAGENAAAVDLSKVSARKNLNETAFFFPQLTSDSNGVVRITFTMPEALTTWRFLGFAYDRQLRSGYLEDKAVTAKDLMVQPNPPRFLREGDVLEFTVKVSNQTAARQEGKVRLDFSDALSGESADKLLGVSPVGVPPSGGGAPAKAGTTNPELAFDIPAKESRTFSWRLTVPDGCGFLSYKTVASTGRVSDGEEGYLPVLSRRIFVTESLPLPIRGKVGGGEVVKKFEFTKLLQSGRSRTLRNEGLTVQMVSQPAWYAVMALPYLMEFPHECTEQTFNRLYANALARFILSS